MSSNVTKIAPVEDSVEQNLVVENNGESSDKYEGGIHPMREEDEVSNHLSPKILKEKDIVNDDDSLEIPEVESPKTATKMMSNAVSPGTAKSNASGMSRSLSRKSTIVVEPAKEHKKSYILAFASCVMFGLANYFMSDLSIRCGSLGVFTECIGLFLTWGAFHIYKYIVYKRGKDSHLPYFRKNISPYYEEFLEDAEEGDEENAPAQIVQQPVKDDDDSIVSEVEIDENGSAPVVKAMPKMDLRINVQPINTKPAPLAFHILTWQRFSAPLSRCLVQCSIQFAITACFFFAFKSGVNAGIISTIFSSSCVFTIIIFYFKYGHQISLVDALGTLFILLCVVLIAMGGAGGSTEEEVIKTDEQLKEEKLNLALALIFALISGLTLTSNTVSIQYVIHTGFNLDQANYDGNAMLGVLFTPFFIYYRERYGFIDVCVGTLVIVCVTIGVILFSRALSCGIAGPVQAIENSKTVIQTVMAIIFLGQIPNLMQIMGLVAGSVGVIMIVLQKKKDVAAKEIDTSKK